MKKILTRQKSIINSHIRTVKDINENMSHKEIKSKYIFPVELPKKLPAKNNFNNFDKEKIIKNANKNVVIINNESSYFVLESFLKEHQIKNTPSFILYLSEIWRELSLYSTDYNLGIGTFAFNRYFPLPGLISKRLFDVLDVNKDGYLSPQEFIQGLTIIYCEEICSIIEFIFSFYDFDNDGFISSEDIHAIMSYIPVINSFSDMIDIEEEIQNTLEEIFYDENKKLNINEFTDLIINKEIYEIFIPIISFFFEQKPFSNQEITYFYKDNIGISVKGNIKNFYQIKGKIKLKIEKDENINNSHKDRVIFDFDENKINGLNDDIEKYDTKNQNQNIKDSPHDNKNIDKSNKSIKGHKNNIINNINIKDSINHYNINDSNSTERYNGNKINNDIINNLKKSSTLAKQKNNKIKPSIKKSFSLQSTVNDYDQIKQKLINQLVHNEEGRKKYEIKISELNLNNINERGNDKEDKYKNYRNKTRSMINMEYRDLVSKSKGFKRLENSIPSLIINTKILAKYSSRNINMYDEGLNKYKKGNVIKGLCKSKINFDNDNINEQKKRKITEDSFEIERNEANEFIGIKLKDNNTNNNKDKSDKNVYKNLNQLEEQNKDKITYESYLYKITSNSKKLKKLYFRLYNKHIYYYKNKQSRTHKGMHNLCHYFLELTEDNDNESSESSISVEKNNDSYKEDDESFIDSESKNISNIESEIIVKKINSIDYYCFILISQRGKIQWYLTPEKEIYNNWVESLKLAMSYKDVLEQYEFKEVIGKGKFSFVYYAYDKINKRKVAIKRIDKTKLKLYQLELIKTEIDILNICQHPYVIKLYDVIETFSTIDIILEYCQIGNLYNYLYNKNFNLTEQQIVTYIHKISKAVYSMHNLGIVHRDLKLSNIAMADGNDEDIRILDFGLSKIIGPGEACTESYGTPGYAAPEVINEEKYRFKADIWSIGAIAYFMCTSKLPFDYQTKGKNKTNIILNTINDELKFNDECWKKYSKEAIK